MRTTIKITVHGGARKRVSLSLSLSLIPRTHNRDGTSLCEAAARNDWWKLSRLPPTYTQINYYNKSSQGMLS